MSDMMWTPYEIRVLLWHHVSPSPFEGRSAPIYLPTMERFIEMGLVKKHNDEVFRTTEKADALVDLWRSTPMPVMKWSDPRFEEING